MLVARILQKDFLRKKIVTIVVFGFILLAALLVVSGSNLILQLNSALNALFSKSSVPHFMQMHVGEFDQAQIDRWAAANSLVKAQQTVEMITIDGTSLYLGEGQTAQDNSVMDISFVKQNETFDFLLDLESQVIQVSPGEIAVPIYYMKQESVKLGDPVTVRDGTFEATFRVAAFARDAQMNSSIVHSKRFLVHDADYAALRGHFEDTEYLIEFLLTDPSQVGAFSKAYLASGLPNKGPSLDHRLFKSLNALTDGIVAGVVIVLSLLLMVIAILCLRFTILATIEEDYQEIGVMKAIGIARRDVRRIYMVKYVLLGALASLLGYLLSRPLNRVLAANILLYIGSAPKNAIQHAVPVAAAGSIFVMVWISCLVILGRFDRITAVQALRSGSVGESLKRMPILDLAKSKLLDVNVFLGLRDVFQRGKLFGLLYFVFFFCAAIILIPVHFVTTIQSPTFIAYMGSGRSDIRIDLRQSDNVAGRFDELVTYLTDDPDVARFSPLVTSQFTMVGSDGTLETIKVETGDFSLFPLDYVEGAAPGTETEIALSVLNAREMDLRIGDTLTLLVKPDRPDEPAGEREMVVSGIYQDVTSGGRTAKAALPYDPESVVGYTVSLDLNAQDRVDDKKREYAEAFYPARVTDMEGYLAQTLGNTIGQLEQVTMVAIVLGLLVSMLITSLFLNMLITKDSSQIAILRGLGFSLRNIRVQYLARALILLSIGIALGTVFSNTLGQRLVSALWSFRGASQIRFIIDPIQAYVLFPLLLMLTVSITTLFSITGIVETNIAASIKE